MRLLLISSIVFAGSVVSLAKGPKFTDIKSAGVDYGVQGEYVGLLKTKQGTQKYGVQLIALGNHHFRVVGYRGGLPGAGWNGKGPIQVQADVELKEGKLVFEGDQRRGVLQGGRLVVDLGPDGTNDGELKRVDRQSPTLGKKDPNAVVLFDGKDAAQFAGGRMTKDGLLMEGTRSQKKFQSHHLHIEFQLPFQPEDRGQGRGNSGIYVQGRYEVQMLDSFGLAGKHNECGGIYEVKDPDLNMCFPPLTWQTYDIAFTAAVFDEAGKLTRPARITVRHNGVLVHDNVELPRDRSTRAAPLKPGPQPGPIYLQNHGCPVRYRNIWVVETR